MKFQDAKKLHELLRMGIDDLKKTPYKINMNCWFDGCHCCMAGAVLAASGYQADGIVHYQRRQLVGKHAMPIEGSEALVAIDELRQGHISDAYFIFYNKDMPDIWNESVIGYHEDQEAFYQDMEAIYTGLKERDI